MKYWLFISNIYVNRKFLKYYNFISNISDINIIYWHNIVINVLEVQHIEDIYNACNTEVGLL